MAIFRYPNHHFSFMKPAYLILILMFVFFACQNASQHQSKAYTQEEVKTVIDDFFSALSQGDSTLMRSLLTEDFHMFEHDVRWNQDSLLSLMPVTLGRIWEVSELDINQEHGLVHVSYFNNSANPKGRSWFESMLLTETKDGLKIKFMHSTKLYLN